MPPPHSFQGNMHNARVPPIQFKLSGVKCWMIFMYQNIIWSSRTHYVCRCLVNIAPQGQYENLPHNRGRTFSVQIEHVKKTYPKMKGPNICNNLQGSETFDVLTLWMVDEVKVHFLCVSSVPTNPPTHTHTPISHAMSWKLMFKLIKSIYKVLTNFLYS